MDFGNLNQLKACMHIRISIQRPTCAEMCSPTQSHTLSHTHTLSLKNGYLRQTLRRRHAEYHHVAQTQHGKICILSAFKWEQLWSDPLPQNNLPGVRLASVPACPDLL